MTLSALQVTAAFLVFVGWIAIFAAGMVVDSKPYRTLISPTAAVESALIATDAAKEKAPQLTASALAVPPGQPSRMSVVWAFVLVLFCYLPLNLAWICASASALGAFGEQANLAEMPPSRRVYMCNNPYLAAVLRGFFVYLFLLSGLLLLDDTPFFNPNPGQYVRLAGFLSLSSFVVSYQPKLFNVLIVWAFHRIEARESDDPGQEQLVKHARRLSHAEVTHAVYNVDERVDVPKISDDIHVSEALRSETVPRS
jgi:hypothetical protein